jgi:hypothetical protein
MKKSIFIIAVTIIVFSGCRNQEQNLNADVEIPVSVENIKLKSIEEFINTTGTAFPKGEILLKSKITASYYLEKNPGTSRFWQSSSRPINLILNLLKVSLKSRNRSMKKEVLH